MLPRIVASSAPEPYGVTSAHGPFGAELPITGALGDQQAATVGQVCLAPGEAKNTYGTGSFLLLNTGAGDRPTRRAACSPRCASSSATQPAVFALEGSIAVTGSAVQWLRDQLGIISAAAQSETLAAQVDDTGGAYFVPAFSGLFAPYWRADARGAIVGLSRFHTSAHLARATLEAIGYQTRDVVEAMEQDSGVRLEVLKVDGGVTANDLCMQLQADILGVPVQPGGRRDHRARCRLRGRPGRPASGVTLPNSAPTGTSPGGGPRRGPRTAGRTATPAGVERSSAPWTGLTWANYSERRRRVPHQGPAPA